MERNSNNNASRTAALPMGVQQLAAAALGRGRRRVGGGVVEVDAGAGHGGRVRVCSWVGWG
jgi:hypothetical protein